MINASALGVAGGIIWGLAMFISTILAMYTGYATSFLSMMESVYPGYSISWAGCFIGAIYGFIDLFIGLSLIAWLYNKLRA